MAETALGEAELAYRRPLLAADHAPQDLAFDERGQHGPVATRTRLGGDAFTRFPEVVEGLAARTALGRVGEPDDIGAVIATLVSDESRWVTAQNIEISGGFNL
ncbi:SDR family oxidoreductase [Nonomuraea longispora]|uniref:SDR family oxidoreductase n=1 Tax=Nonomuraea longispora TaxID=1848320 RepID=A0A4R4N1F2_9ACTN|nr:SDR family oxidoreductase [Nonomuraea longispora]TDC00873.1 SDR family oxidoreductase [Nonomuraea longispora]